MTSITDLKGSWNEKKRRLKQKFELLTDNDLFFASGKKEEMMKRLELKLGKTREELFKIIAAL